MKKILIVAICVLFASVSIATALPISSNTNLKIQIPDTNKPDVNSGESSTPQSGESTPIKQTPDTSGTGTFVGVLSYSPNGEKVGDISGFLTKNKFQGDWTTSKNSGTIQFSFGRHILIGKIMTAGKTMPIIGFYTFDETAKTFAGRFMSVVGPALYFRGTYT